MLPVDQLRKVDLEATLNLGQFTVDKLPMDDVSLKANGKAGLLTLEDLRGGLFGGSFQANAQIDARQAVPLLKAHKRIGPERWRELAAGTSILPFAALLSGRARWQALRALVLPALIAAALYIWFVLQGHALLIGPDPLAGLTAMG